MEAPVRRDVLLVLDVRYWLRWRAVGPVMFCASGRVFNKSSRILAFVLCACMKRSNLHHLGVVCRGQLGFSLGAGCMSLSCRDGLLELNGSRAAPNAFGPHTDMAAACM